MRTLRAHASLVVFIAVATLSLTLWATPQSATAQTAPTPAPATATNSFNPPPCDYNDTFYKDNGVDPAQVVDRFGSTRRTGPPASGTQVNWVADSTCAQRDPDRRNFRILATTAGFPDDGTGTATDFISLIGFLVSQTAFETSYSRTVGAINGGLDGDQQNPGETISISGRTIVSDPNMPPFVIADSANPRGITMQNLVSNFEAYPAVKQRLANGVLALNPCQADIANTMLAPATPCFDVGNVSAVFTPNLRQDWRFASNRNAMDGSDNNCILDTCGAPSDSPFGYFCDDLLGLWVNTYFWFTVDPANPPKNPVGNQAMCPGIMKTLGQTNGFNLDGTPIVKTANELNNDLEANGCAAEGKLAFDGTDGGAIWDVCPAIPDPRAGAIARDAFLDQVVNSNGVPQNIGFTLNFLSLQIFGVFFNELTSGQKSEISSSAAAASSARATSL
ncbi:MAG TPA: hypothetical protein VHS76_09175 [Steroidobacteraceae bacterium]|jgi:hypothetical protein|nr:hypothetical protein [Steroidobacteraceae bacterium]